MTDEECPAPESLKIYINGHFLCCPNIDCRVCIKGYEDSSGPLTRDEVLKKFRPPSSLP